MHSVYKLIPNYGKLNKILPLKFWPLSRCHLQLGKSIMVGRINIL